MISTLRYCATPVIVLIMFVTCAEVFAAKDTTIVLENNVIATHHLAHGTPKAAVLMVHGWASQMDEVSDMRS
jgi:hypothetical protein